MEQVGGKTKIYRNSFETILKTEGGYLMNNLSSKANVIASIVSGQLLTDFDLLMEDDKFRSKFKTMVKDTKISINDASDELIEYANNNIC